MRREELVDLNAFLTVTEEQNLTRAAARLFGLGFIPLVSERYDLAIRRQHLELPGIRALMDVLSRSQFRRELDSLGGYDTRTAGQRMG